MNRASQGVRLRLKFQLESISSRCLTPASWMTRESGTPNPLSRQANWVAEVGLQSLWRETRRLGLACGGWSSEEPASPRLQARPGGPVSGREKGVGVGGKGKVKIKAMEEVGGGDKSF